MSNEQWSGAYYFLRLSRSRCLLRLYCFSWTYRSLAWARLSSQFLRKLQPGIMNHISRRAAAGTNADAGLVHHRERKMALHHSPWNQGGPVLHDDCQRRMQAFKSDF